MSAPDKTLSTLSALFSFLYIVLYAYTPQLSLTFFDQRLYQVFYGSLLKMSPIVIFSIITYKTKKTPEARYTSFALALSSVGDFLLDMELVQNSINGQYYFLAGLAFFLVAHLSYAIAFSQHEIEHSLFRASFFSLLPMVSMALHYSAIPSLQRPAIFFYSCVIAFMAYVASSVNFLYNEKKRVFTLSGVFLFVLSDSFLASDRFGSFIIPQSKLLVMLTYYSAQYLLMSACILQDRENSKDV